MTRIGTGLSSKTRAYTVSNDTTFRLLESAVPQGSQVPIIGTVSPLSAGPIQTLDSSYVQGLVIYNDSTVAGEFMYVAGIEYNGKTLGAPDNAANTAFKVLPGEAIAIDCRDGSGICIAFSAGVRNARVFGN